MRESLRIGLPQNKYVITQTLNTTIKRNTVMSTQITFIVMLIRM